ncbi:hypothetical protein HS9_04317 [Bacillus velezensis]|nr:hypothetical protein HS9_04317 [Bacillus velezensis]
MPFCKTGCRKCPDSLKSVLEILFLLLILFFAQLIITSFLV